MVTKNLGDVESVCPECLGRITGRLLGDGDCVRMEKKCRQHGIFSTVLWRGKPSFTSWYRPKLPFLGTNRPTQDQGCPFDCGLCACHGQRTCTALVEITPRCNLHCPVCFADSGPGGPEPDLPTLVRMFDNIRTQSGDCNLQLSGGEPTLRSDLPEIVRAAKTAGFTFIQVNSNGLRFAEDPHLAGRLQDEGLSSVFLQFDGVDDRVFTALRGRPLFAEKCLAIDNLATAGVAIVLVPTLVPGVNIDQIWQIVRFGLQRQPQVRGVHFQPISYFGRFPGDFAPQHITLPEIMQALEGQSLGQVKAEDFRPPGCEHALCSFSAKYLVEKGGQLTRLGGSPCDCTPIPAEEGARLAIAGTARRWGSIPVYTPPPVPEKADELDRFLQRARNHTFALSAMAFQDCWNLSLERLRGCCVHVAQADGRLIPFCSFNLTARGGQGLHRPPPTGIPNIPTTSVDKLAAKRLGISEKLTRKALEQRQMAALRHTLQHAAAGSAFYRQRLANIDIHSLQSPSDLATLPLMRSSDIVKNGLRLLAVSQSRIARIVTMQTSGSTGPAKRLWFTAADLAGTLEFFLAGMHSLVDTRDRVLILLPFSLADSVGDLLHRALRDGGIEASGHWPPDGQTMEIIGRDRPTCLVGLPQHLLALAEAIGPGLVQSMLLCSDYAAPALRRRIEAACGCQTFLHYGATETGLGGAVECTIHSGCHLRESDLLVEIVDPHSGRPLADGVLGEIVVTTLGREAMPLIRYRTGDSARLARSTCRCGGITARLMDIRGRLDACPLPTGNKLYSQDLDDVLYAIPGLLDYRIILDSDGPERLHAEILATSAETAIVEHFRQKILLIPAIRDNVATGRLLLGTIRRVTGFAATHTVKRTILDLRSTGERYAACSR
jgi:7,8-dihydro-6-hydroxymethylpterin dimethyltransferase